ncbi:hypothetical protein [Nocardioides pakistanensis]
MSQTAVVDYDYDSAEDDDFEVPGDRHATLHSLTDRLHAILVGQAAEALLSRPEGLPDEAGLWVTPSWVWLFSRVDVGRKDRALDGSRLRLPVRLDWSQGPLVFVAEGEKRVCGWTAAGLGHSGTGTVSVSVSPSAVLDAIEADIDTGLPQQVVLAVRGRVALVTELERLVEEGRSARWSAMLYLEPYIESALHRAHASVAHELSVASGEPQKLLDETKLASIRDRMLLGDEDHPGKIAQLLDRCLKPTTFAKVEPLKYIKESLRRDANTEVRRAIGDPHIGHKVRRVAREIGTDDLDQIIATYRERYPNDRLSKQRAAAAMSVAPDAMASWWGLHPTFGEG